MEDTNPLSYMLSLILFVVLIIAPIPIANLANSYMEHYKFKQMADEFFEQVMADRAVTADNYTALLNECAEFGIAADFTVTRDSTEFYSNKTVMEMLNRGERLDIITGDFMELQIEYENYVIYRSKTAGIN